MLPNSNLAYLWGVIRDEAFSECLTIRSERWVGASGLLVNLAAARTTMPAVKDW